MIMLSKINKIEKALMSLFLCLETRVEEIGVLKNEVLNTTIPEDGLIILRDGNLEESELVLSPVRYIHRHRAEIEIIIQDVDAGLRDEKFAELVTKLEDIMIDIVENRLEGLVDIIYPGFKCCKVSSVRGSHQNSISCYGWF